MRLSNIYRPEAMLHFLRWIENISFLVPISGFRQIPIPPLGDVPFQPTLHKTDGKNERRKKNLSRVATKFLLQMVIFELPSLRYPVTKLEVRLRFVSMIPFRSNLLSSLFSLFPSLLHCSPSQLLLELLFSHVLTHYVILPHLELLNGLLLLFLHFNMYSNMY